MNFFLCWLNILVKLWNIYVFIWFYSSWVHCLLYNVELGPSYSSWFPLNFKVLVLMSVRLLFNIYNILPQVGCSRMRVGVSSRPMSMTERLHNPTKHFHKSTLSRCHMLDMQVMKMICVKIMGRGGDGGWNKCHMQWIPFTITE